MKVMKSIVIGILTVATLTACSLDSLVKVNDAEIGREVSQGFLKSKEGALGMFNSSLSQLQKAVSLSSVDIGIFTDELAAVPLQGRGSANWTLIEPRIEVVDAFRGGYVSWYSILQKARVTALQARDLAKTIDNTDLQFIKAASYAVEGFSILMLAENFCSGVPLTHVSFDGKIDYSNPASSEEMYNKAISLFDSALASDTDSARYKVLAAMGKARSYLAIGAYGEAVSSFTDNAETESFEIMYAMQLTPGSDKTTYQNAFWPGDNTSSDKYQDESQTVNHDGINGLVWYTSPTSIDPRVPVSTAIVNGQREFTTPYVRQEKFVGDSKFPLVHKVQRKLIEAEYLLSENDPEWLTLLNEMRREINLPDTTDPGSVESRVNLLFRERAYWLFLEGTRLSDMRRLVRQYHRDPYSVFPTGPYNRASGNHGIEFYGDLYSFVPDTDEFRYNYKYDGCIHKRP